MIKKGINQYEYDHITQVGKYSEEDQLKHDNHMLNKDYLGKSKQEMLDAYLHGDPNLELSIVSDGGNVKVIPLKVKALQEVCTIDWINFTVNEESFNSEFAITDSDLIRLTSERVESIFGFGITLVRANGANFYDRSYQLGDQYGMVCHGGNNNTIMVTVNGTGLMNAKSNWENSLFRFLQSAISPSITRVDLAHDIYNAPKYLIDHYLRLYDLGGFTTYRQPPSVGQLGNWLTPNEDGRTLNIGKRTNGLYTRIYEKGLQLKSVDFPTWLRLEAEIKSKDRIIPHDVLLNPHDYFAGLYPCFRSFNRKASRIETFKKELNADFNRRVKWGKHQSGGLVCLLKELNYTDMEIVQMLKRNDIPKVFKRKFTGNSLPSIHAEPASVIANTIMLDNIFQE